MICYSVACLFTILSNTLSSHKQMVLRDIDVTGLMLHTNNHGKIDALRNDGMPLVLDPSRCKEITVRFEIDHRTVPEIDSNRRCEKMKMMKEKSKSLLHHRIQDIHSDRRLFIKLEDLPKHNNDQIKKRYFLLRKEFTKLLNDNDHLASEIGSLKKEIADIETIISPDLLVELYEGGYLFSAIKRLENDHLKWDSDVYTPFPWDRPDYDLVWGSNE